MHSVTRLIYTNYFRGFANTDVSYIKFRGNFCRQVPNSAMRFLSLIFFENKFIKAWVKQSCHVTHSSLLCLAQLYFFPDWLFRLVCRAQRSVRRSQELRVHHYIRAVCLSSVNQTALSNRSRFISSFIETKRNLVLLPNELVPPTLAVIHGSTVRHCQLLLYLPAGKQHCFESFRFFNKVSKNLSVHQTLI